MRQLRESRIDPREYWRLSELRKDSLCLGQMLKREGALFLYLVELILVAYRHGLRAAELVDLRWDRVDFNTATLHVRRVKQGTPSTHPNSVWASKLPELEAPAYRRLKPRHP